MHRDRQTVIAHLLRSVRERTDTGAAGIDMEGTEVIFFCKPHCCNGQSDAASSEEATDCITDRNVTHFDHNVARLQGATATLKGDSDGARRYQSKDTQCRSRM